MDGIDSPVIPLERIKESGLSFNVESISSKKVKKKQEEVETLVLKHFSATPKLSFENVKVGSTKSIFLRLQNPTDDFVQVQIKKFPFSEGFNICSCEFGVESHGNQVIEISWMPQEEGNCREKVLIETNNNLRLQFVLLGSAKSVKANAKKRSMFKQSKENKFPTKISKQKSLVDKVTPSKRRRSVQKSFQKPYVSTTVSSTVHHREITRPLTDVNRTDNITSNTSNVFSHVKICPETDFPTTPIRRQTFTKTSCTPKEMLEMEDQRRVTYCKKFPAIQEQVFNDSLENSTCFDDSLEVEEKKFTHIEVEETEFTHFEVEEKEITHFEVEEKKITHFEVEETEFTHFEVEEKEITHFEVEEKKITHLEVEKKEFRYLEDEKEITHFRKRWVIESKDTFDEIFKVADAENSSSVDNDTFDVQKLTVLHQQTDNIDEKRCSTGIKSKIPPLETLENISCVEILSKELFPVHSKSPEVPRLSTETFTTSPMHADEPSTSLEQTTHELPVINKESTVGFVTSPRKKFIKPRRRSPVKVSKKAKGVVRGSVSLKTGVRSPTKTEKLRRKAALQRSSSASSKSVLGVPQRKLALMKPKRRTAIPQHPNPFAAKNMFYDEKWMDKQERGFTRWLNFFLTPPEELSTSDHITKVDAGKLWIECKKTNSTVIEKAPTKEDLSFKAYTAKRRLNKLRRAACILFQSEPFVRVISKIEAELEKDRISVRPDRALHADLGIKQQILDMLLCYNPLWLRIGLETVYGAILPLQSNSDVLGISRFIVRRLLNCPDICMEYAHPSVPHLYKPGFEQAMKKYTLKKFLLLIYFLDRAKLTRLIDHDPCLFCFDAQFKSSREMLLTFSRDFLRGEGDLTKHLSYLGFVVSHEQKYLEEFDYAVTNISVDLRCGIRMMKISSLLLHRWTLMHEARVPAISKLQKIHNIGVAFKALEDSAMKLSGGITPKDICEGHREKTLALLWQLIFKFQIEVILNKKKLEKEINFLKNSLSAARSLKDLENFEKAPSTAKNLNMTMDLYFKCESLQLLLQWCQVVCAHYGMTIENFTVSFSDGRAFCYLIHHYHPKLLPLSDIFQQTTQTCKLTSLDSSSSDDSFHETWNKTFSPTCGKPVMSEFLANEKRNFKTAFEKIEELGGVPVLTRSADMSNTIPDEKVVITLLSYLNVRLMDLSDEIRACRIIQLAWKHYKIRKFKRRQQVVLKSVVVIQRAFRAHQKQIAQLKLQRCAVVIQSAFRSHRVRKHFLDSKSAIKVIENFWLAKKAVRNERKTFLAKRDAIATIQTWWRCRMAINRLHRIGKAVVRVQALVRGYLARKHFNVFRATVVYVQRRYRAKLASRRLHNEFLRVRRSIVKIQSAVRSWQGRRHFLLLRSSAVTIQSAYRAHSTRTCFLKLKEACRVVENRWHAKKLAREEREAFLVKRRAVVRIQTWYRCRKAVTEYQMAIDAAVIIQSRVRGHLALQKFKQAKSSAVKIQRWYLLLKSSEVIRDEYLAMRKAAVTIQSVYRSWKAQQSLRLAISCSVTIQNAYRAYRQRQKFLQMRRSISVIQVVWSSILKGRKCRDEYLALKRHAIVIQTYWRAKKMARAQHEEFKVKRQAIVKLQSSVRGYFARRKFQTTKSAAIKIQRWYLMTKSTSQIRVKYLALKTAAVTIQSAVRCWSARRRYLNVRNSALTIQSMYRMRHERKAFLEVRRSASIIQKFWRAALEGQKCRREYVLLKKSAVVIQTRWRAQKTASIQHEAFVMKRKAAVIIQSFVRGLVARLEFQQMKSSATKIQQWYRLTKAMINIREEYRISKKAAITIQSACRRWNARRNFLLVKKCAVTLQSAYRMYQQRKSYIETRRSVRIVQKFWLAVLKGRKCRQEFLSLKRSAVVVQTRWRAKKLAAVQRQDFVTKREAAVTIQSYFRGRLVRRELREMKSAAVEIQRWYRATKAMMKIRAEFQMLKMATITIQSAFRCWKARRNFLLVKSSAVTLQSTYRMYRQRKIYSEIRCSVCFIQKVWMAVLEGRKCRENYLLLKKSTGVLQTRWRAKKMAKVQRQDFLAKREAIITIQSFVRGNLARREFQNSKSAAIKIQQWYLMTKSATKLRREFLELKMAAVTMQSWYRCRKARCRLLLVKRSAVVIQNAYRAYRLRVHFVRICQSVSVIQKYWLAVCRGRRCRNEYLALRKNAVTIQSRWRGILARRRHHQLQFATVQIQSWWRGVVERRRYLELKKSAIVAQKLYRNKIVCRCAQDSYLTLKKSIIYLQATRRAVVERRKFLTMKKSAVLIQSFIRMANQRKKFIALKASVKVIQIRYKAWNEGRRQFLQYHVQRGAVICIQSWLRMSVARQKYKIDRKSCIIIQSAVRRHIARKEYLRKMAAIRVIQTRFRATTTAAKHVENYRRVRLAIVKIQAVFKGFLVRKRQQSIKMAAICIQRTYRARKVRQRYVIRRKSAVVLQRYWRARRSMRSAREQYLRDKSAVVMLQTTFRAKLERRRYVRFVHNVRLVQRRWRSTLLARKVRLEYLEQCRAASKLQSQVRAFLAAKSCRAKYKKMKKAAILIQAVYRSYLVRKHLQGRRTAAVVIQSHVRRCLARRQFLQLKRQDVAARVIQDAYRSYCSYKIIQEQKKLRQQHLQRFTSAVYFNLKIITIQRFYRNSKIREQARRELSSVILIQNWIRAKLARLRFLKMKTGFEKLQEIYRKRFETRQGKAIIIQACVRSWMARKYAQKWAHSIVTIQAYWRGYRVRRRTTSKKLVDIRKRLKSATDKATEGMKLYQRTKCALDYLLECKNITTIIAALQHLDVVTSLSAICCEKMAEANAVDTIYKLVQSCNRSMPHMEVIKYSVNILLNLAKYDKTVNFVRAIDCSADALLELMSIFREKGQTIFTKCCTLLWILVQDKDYAQSVGNLPKNVDKIRSLRFLVERKNKLKSIKSKRNSSTMLNQSTRLVKKVPSTNNLKIQPDWILGKHFREFTDPYQSISSVANQLSITQK